MNGFELCAILAATEKDCLPGTWERVQEGQKGILADLREAPTEDLQKVADWCHWAAAAAECVDSGLITGPRVNVAGAEQVIKLANDRGLKVPVADVGESFFSSAGG